VKLPIRYLIPGILALGVLLLYSRSNQTALSEHERFNRKLERLDKLDSELNQDVLKARFRMLPDYDSFTEKLDSLDKTASALSTLSASVSGSGHGPFRDKLAEFAQLLTHKEQLIEQFKSENAVLNNSLRYLPIASSDLLTSLHVDAEGESLETPMNRLMQQVFVHSLLSVDEEEPAIRQSLSLLANWRAQHPDHPQAAAVATVAAHVTSIITRKPKIEALTQQIISIPTSACTEQLLRIQESRLAATMHESDVLQHALEAICALLLLGIGYTLYALQAANRNLERRVEERTQALQSEIAGHCRTADERDRFFAGSLDLLCIAGTDGFSRRVNPAIEKVLGWTAEESLARPFIEFVHPDDRSAIVEKVQRAAGGEAAFNVEVRCLCKDGSHRWIAWTTTAADADGLFFSCGRDVTDRKRAETDLDTLHKQLLETSRHAGMAEVATGVLHNVGNVLNSVNVSVTLVSESVKKSKITNLGRVVTLLDQKAADLGAFVTSDAQGKNLPHYLRQLHERLGAEQCSILAEVESLRQNVEHIKDIVSMQQEYAKVSGVTEIMKVTDLVEDSLRMNAAALVRHDVTVERDYQEVPPVAIEKHKTLQILVNLIRNAKYACDEGGRIDKRLTLRVANGNGRIKISVADNGIGIPPENLTRIFNHGFTTRKEGHGFGLHSGALAAREMGGCLTVHSDGPGAGATFTLELPVDAPAS